MSLTVINESSIFLIGVLVESLNDSLRWITFAVFALMLRESIRVSLFLSNLTVVSLIVSFSIKLN